MKKNRQTAKKWKNVEQSLKIDLKYENNCKKLIENHKKTQKNGKERRRVIDLSYKKT